MKRSYKYLIFSRDAKNPRRKIMHLRFRPSSAREKTQSLPADRTNPQLGSLASQRCISVNATKIALFWALLRHHLHKNALPAHPPLLTCYWKMHGSSGRPEKQRSKKKISPEVNLLPPAGKVLFRSLIASDRIAPFSFWEVFSFLLYFLFLQPKSTITIYYVPFCPTTRLVARTFNFLHTFHPSGRRKTKSWETKWCKEIFVARFLLFISPVLKLCMWKKNRKLHVHCTWWVFFTAPTLPEKWLQQKRIFAECSRTRMGVILV